MGRTSTKKRKGTILPYIFLLLSILFLILAIWIKNNNDQKNQGQAVLLQESIDLTQPENNENNSSSEADFIEVTEPIEDLSSKITLPFTLFSESAYLFDLDSQQVLYTKNPENKMSPASLTKMMTALLALEMTDDLDSKILTFTEEMANELNNYGYALNDIATYNFEVGEQITMRSALYILMLRSANDAANLIAYELGNGSIDTFVDMMNDKAKELGANNTNFTNPHGLDDDSLYTTAYDMFLITEAAMKYPVFINICSAVTYPLPATNLREALTIETVIGIHHPQNYQYYNEYVTGIKTGYTNAAGKCLISKYTHEGKNYLLVLMGTPLRDVPPGQFYEETSLLYDWAYTTIV